MASVESLTATRLLLLFTFAGKSNISQSKDIAWPLVTKHWYLSSLFTIYGLNNYLINGIVRDYLITKTTVSCCPASIFLVWPYPRTVERGLSAAAAAAPAESPAASCEPECCSMCPTWRTEPTVTPTPTPVTRRALRQKLNNIRYTIYEPRMCGTRGESVRHASCLRDWPFRLTGAV